MLADIPEVVIGEVPVTARLTVGVERLSLFFTNERLIIARIGKRSAGSMTALPIFAGITSGLEALFKRRREKSKKRSAESLTPEGILAADKDNFSVKYNEVVSVELVQSPLGNKITMVTTNEKLLFTTPLAFDKLTRLIVNQLQDRVTVRKNPVDSLR